MIVHRSFRWGTATECQADCEGTIDTHYYYDTLIVLEKGSMSYGQTIGAGGGATFSDFSPNEDGSIWRIAKITIPPMQKDSPRGDQGLEQSRSMTKTSTSTPRPTTKVSSASQVAMITSKSITLRSTDSSRGFATRQKSLKSKAGSTNTTSQLAAGRTTACIGPTTQTQLVTVTQTLTSTSTITTTVTCTKRRGC